MFNRTQWLTVATLFVLGVVAHAMLKTSQLASGHLAQSIGFMIPAIVLGLIGGAIGRRRSEHAATNGIVIGFGIALALMTTEHWL